MLPVPTGLTVSQVAGSASQLSLSWNAVTGVVSYVVYRNGTAVANPTGTTYTDSGLAAGTTYSYQVAGKTSSGSIGPKSNTVSGTTHSIVTYSTQFGNPFVSSGLGCYNASSLGPYGCYYDPNHIASFNSGGSGCGYGFYISNGYLGTQDRYVWINFGRACYSYYNIYIPTVHNNYSGTTSSYSTGNVSAPGVFGSADILNSSGYLGTYANLTYDYLA